MLRKTINILLIIMLLPFNSSFIYLAADGYSHGCDRLSSGATTNVNCDQLPIVFENNSFEELSVAMPAQGYIITDQNNVPGWNTTSTDGKIEVWNKKFYNSNVGTSGNWGITGDQFVELNATQNAALYQDFATEPGQTIKIYLNHGGRSNGETMNVVVGTPENNASATKPTVGGSADIIATDTVNLGQWNDVAVEYVVPEGQTTTRIAFVSAGSNHYSSGNFIDNVNVGIDSVYDNSLEIQSNAENASYADSFKITNHLSYESGAYLGKFKLVIDAKNFTNLRNPHIYNSYGVEMPLENVTYENDTITIEGGYFEEGYVTFEADSALQTAGTLEISSTLNYLSLMDVALIEAGLKEMDSYYWVKNTASLEVVNKGPELTASEVIIDEGSTYSEEELLNMLDVTVLDYEDNKMGLELTYVNGPVNLDQSIPGVYDIEFSAKDSQGTETIETFPITVADAAPIIELDKESIEIKVGSDISRYSNEALISLFGAVATEINYGDVSNQITVSHNINTSVTGEYDITFNVTDNDGTQAEAVHAKVLVVRTIGEDITGITPGLNTAPTLSVSHSKQAINEETVYTDEQLLESFGVIASDSTGDVLTLKVDQSDVNYSVPGTYDVSFTVTDKGNLSKTVTTSLTIVDVLPGITEVSNFETITMREAPTDADLINLYGIVATEISSGDLNNKIHVLTNLNTNVTGTYLVNFSVNDDEGNAVSTTVSLKVIRNIPAEIDAIFPGRNTAPKITANSSGVIVEEHILSHEQLIEVYKVTVSDEDDEQSSLKIIVDDSNVDYSTPGTYPITFSVTDSGGLTASKTVTLRISDVKPVISSERSYVEVFLNADVSSSSLIELFGIKATELKLGDLTSSVSTSNISSNQTGLYQVSFLVADAEGNVAIKTVELKVIRNLDIDGIGVLPERNTAPILTATPHVISPEEKQLTEDQLIELFEVEISDGQDQANKLLLLVDDSQINYSTPGTYPVTFSVTDSGNLSKVQTVDIEITDLKPEINVERDIAEVNLNSDVSNEALINIFGATATEITPGDLSTSISTSKVKSNVTGIYQVNFKVADEEGNKVVKTVSLKVIRDENGGGTGVLPELNVAPKITAIPVAEINEEAQINSNKLIELYGVQVTDTTDDSKDLKISVDYSRVNMSKPGQYPIVFSVTDSGKLTTKVKVMLVVKDVIPTIQLTNKQINISSNTNITSAELINRFGVIATEIVSGDLKKQIIIEGDYQDLSSGDNVVIFHVSDEEGNTVSQTGIISIDEPLVTSPSVTKPLTIRPITKPSFEITNGVITSRAETRIEQPTNSGVLSKAKEDKKKDFEWVDNEDGLKTIVQAQTYNQISDNSQVIKQYAQDLALLTSIIVTMISVLLGYKIFINKRA